jgi:TRAP-type mannitol/chloroaromatic compound transport system permease small subunit
VQELFYVLCVVLAVGIVLTIMAVRTGAILAWLEKALTIGSTALILFTMCFVTLEIVLRHWFNSPIQGHLELSSLFVPVIVFAAVSYTQSQNAHVGMTLIVDNLPAGVKNRAYFSFKFTYGEWEIDNVTETPPYWLTWKSAVFIPIGYSLLAMRCLLQMVHRIAPDYYPEHDIILADELLAPEGQNDKTPA